MKPYHSTGHGLRRLSARLSPPARARARKILEQAPYPVRRRLELALGGSPGWRIPRWGNLRRFEPFSWDFGFERGLPVDRVFIEDFLNKNAADIKGVCLEVLDATYTRRFGGGAVAQADVVDLDAQNPAATVIADLGVPASLPVARYDCIILTQTLHLIPRMDLALQNAYRALRDGGVMLLTTSTISRHVPDPGFAHDLWRFTPAGLEEHLRQQLPEAPRHVEGYGNLVTTTAALYGIVAEELRPHELRYVDPNFPVIAAARVVKASS